MTVQRTAFNSPYKLYPPPPCPKTRASLSRTTSALRGQRPPKRKPTFLISAIARRSAKTLGESNLPTPTRAGPVRNKGPLRAALRHHAVWDKSESDPESSDRFSGKVW